MFFIKSYSERIASDIHSMLLDMLTVKGKNVIRPFFNLNPRIVGEEIYEAYSKDFRLRKALNEEQTNAKIEMYSTDIKEAIKLLDMYKSKFPKLIKKLEENSWIHWRVGEKNKNKTEYRLYVNTKIGQLNKFVNEMLLRIYSGKFHCDTCGANRVGIDNGNKLRCSDCGYGESSFKFKFHRPKSNSPVDLLRHDKIVFYFDGKDILESVICLISSMPKKYFNPYTPRFTQEIRPGVGYSNEPNNLEILDYNESVEESNSQISAGQYLSQIVAEIYVQNALKPENKEKIDRLKKIFSSIRKTENKTLLYREAHRIIKEILKDLPALLLSNSKFKRWCKRLEKINVYELAA